MKCSRVAFGGRADAPRGASRAAVLVVVVGTLASACSSGAETTPALPDKNIDQWVMPLDDYSLGYRMVSDYAEGLLTAPCMQDAGYAFDLPWVDINAAPPATRSATMRRLFDESIARQWGYHEAPSNQPNAEALAALNSQELDEAASAQLSECTDEARKVLPLPSGNAQLSYSMASAAFDGAVADPDVVAAAGTWRECMAPQGVSDLPPDPTGMPSPSLQERFGLTGDDGSSTISPEETQLAVEDARCRESSGFRQALYDAEWDREVAQLTDNADALARAKAEIDAYDDAAMQVINEHGQQ